jgi:type IV pilus assembly protein PilV
MQYIVSYPKKQAGGFIIEVLVAIVIFSVGVVGLMNMQSYANKTAAEAVYRSEAAMLVNDYINKMAATDRTDATAFISNFVPGGVAYQEWTWRGNPNISANVSYSNPAKGTVFQLLPSTKDKPPEITIREIAPQSAQCISIPADCAPSFHISVEVHWLAPSDKKENDNNNENAYNTFKTTAHIGG